VRALLIDPVARTITEIDVGDADGELYTALGCDWIDRVSLGGGVDLWIDDEGRLAYPNPLGYFKVSGVIFCGRGVLLGVRGPESVALSPLITPEAVAGVVEWLGIPPESEVAPSITITEWEEP
jgi:hypothetical protein